MGWRARDRGFRAAVINTFTSNLLEAGSAAREVIDCPIRRIRLFRPMTAAGRVKLAMN